MTAECSLCGAPAIERFGNGWLCEGCIPDEPAEPTGSQTDTGVRHRSAERGDADSRIKEGGNDDAEGELDPSNISYLCAPDAVDDTEGAAIDDLPAPDVVDGDLPGDLEAREQWLTWKADDGRKIPRSPYANPEWPDKFVDAQDPGVWTDVATAREWGSKLPGHGLAFTISDRDEFPDETLVLVDYDDVRDPETGEVHPVVRDHIERAGSYAQVSTSGTGVHILCRGALPEGVKAVDAQLPEHPTFPGAEIEVYDSARYIAMTGDRIEGTPAATHRAQAFLEDVAETFATVAEGAPDGVVDEPDLSAEDVADLDTTSEFSDVCDAIQHVGPGDIRLRSTITNERSDGSRSLDPSWEHSDSGTRLAAVGDGWVYRKGMHGLDALQVVALEERLITRPDEYPEGDEFWTAVDALRDRGAHIPEFEPAPDRVALLPDVREWGWQYAGRRLGAEDEPITLDEARDRTQAQLERALSDTSGSPHGDPDAVLLEALPTLGKSHGAIRAARETGEPITILTGRGRKEQYAQFRQWCEDAGLSYLTLPSFTRDCDTANGEHGDNWADTVRDWYRRGATPQDIHKFAEEKLGRPLPCQAEGESDCTLAHKWDFDPDEHPETGEPWDVLIGHYAHGHKEKVTAGRTVVVDEFPDAYETPLDPAALPGAVSYFLECTDGLPFDDYTDLVEHRDDPQRRGDALAWFDQHEPSTDSKQAIFSSTGHAAAPIATFALLAGAAEDLGNGWERADLDAVGARGVGLHDRETGAVHLLRPPPLEYASGVVALDGTPTQTMWELALGLDLDHRQVLGPAERREYIQEALELQLVRTTDWIKPYNSREHVNVDEDAALLEGVADEHRRAADLITTSTAEHEYDRHGILADDGLVGEHGHYGDVLGSNRFSDSRLGAVIGSQHFGDAFVEKWGAYASEPVGRNNEKGTELSYGPLGDDILTHMREHETLQAAMRFGRDGNGAVVYIHTDTLPEWAPIAGEGRVLETWSDGRKAVLEAAAGRGEWTTAELAEDVPVGERQVRNHLHDLADEGVVDLAIEGGRFVWRDDGLHRVSEHGEVELDPVDVEDLDEDEAAELSRSTIYTWDFRSSGGRTGVAGRDAPDGPEPLISPTVDSGAPPPDPGG